MGMSEDMEPAIAEGATIVRVGTAIFGPRRYPIPEELAAARVTPLRARYLSFSCSFVSVISGLRAIQSTGHTSTHCAVS